MTDSRPTESQCQATIVAAAKLLGWKVHATRQAMTRHGWRTPVQGDAGFPDLLLVRGSQLMCIELKRKPNRVEPEQQGWLDALAAAGVDVCVVWVPEQMHELLAELAERRPVGAGRAR